MSHRSGRAAPVRKVSVSLPLLLAVAVAVVVALVGGVDDHGVPVV